MLDEAFDKNAVASCMDGAREPARARCCAMLRELASERDTESSCCGRRARRASLAAMSVDDCRIERQHMPLLLPAIAAWVWHAPKGAPFEAEPL